MFNAITPLALSILRYVKPLSDELPDVFNQFVQFVNYLYMYLWYNNNNQNRYMYIFYTELRCSTPCKGEGLVDFKTGVNLSTNLVYLFMHI